MKLAPIDIDKLIEDNESKIDKIMNAYENKVDAGYADKIAETITKKKYEDNKAINRVIKIIKANSELFPMLDNSEEIIPKLEALKHKKVDIDPWLFDLTVFFAMKTKTKPRSYHSPYGDDHPFYIFIKRVYRKYKQTPPSQSKVQRFLKELNS
jgi:hypothetical protein